MSEKNDEKKEEQIESSNSNIKENPITLFSKKEIDETVKRFVLAYIHGQITIDFPSAVEIKERSLWLGTNISKEEALDQERKYSSEFQNQINIIVGITPASTDQSNVAINKMFGSIILLRNAKRIEGNFMESKLEERLNDLKRKLDTTNNVIEQLVKWLTEEAKGNEMS